MENHNNLSDDGWWNLFSSLSEDGVSVLSFSARLSFSMVNDFTPTHIELLKAYAIVLNPDPGILVGYGSGFSLGMEPGTKLKAYTYVAFLILNGLLRNNHRSVHYVFVILYC